MNAFDKLLSGLPIQTIGWTLLHSLWQALLAGLVVLIVFRLIPRHHARARYAIALGGLLTTAIISAVTFMLLLPAGPVAPAAPVAFTVNQPALLLAPATAPPASIISSLANALQNNMTWIVTLWFSGALFLSLKIPGGYWYAAKLRNTAVPVKNEWSRKLSLLARQLGITQAVQLAESEKITAPVVIGYLKPVVLVPIGMLTGLTPAQVETIFVHELTHIRRHDYLVNIVQLVMETLYFFNPFVWLLSAAIRKEREYCCDDEVVEQHGNTLAYAEALARLEEARLYRTSLALAAADNKFQLLTRIKRLMEKPVKSHSARERILPFALIALMLVCASWLSFRPETVFGHEQDKLKTTMVCSDTVKNNKKERAARYSRQTIVTLGEDGKPREEVVEEFEGDQDLRPLLAIPDAEAFAAVPAVPGLPAFEAFGDFDIMLPPTPDFNFMTDTFPKSANWEEFGKAFEKMFRERFGDFYETHQQDIEKMMEELSDKFDRQFDFHYETNAEDIRARVQEQMQRAQEMMANQMMHQRQVEIHKVKEAEFMQHHQMRMIELEERMKNLQLQFEMDRVEGLQKEIDVLQKQMQARTARLQAELIGDGYLNQGDDIRDLEWNSDGRQLKVNGKKIKLKEKDKDKYNKLMERK